MAVQLSEGGISLRVSKTVRISSQTMLSGSALLFSADRTFLIELTPEAAAAERRAFTEVWAEALQYHGNERLRDLQRMGLMD